ncbi:MAG: T9SS type A sorting domain-containing protein [Ignavibacteriota bacterium]
MKRILMFIAFFSYTFYALSQQIQPRFNFGALLEPNDKIINGAGQDPVAYNNYWNVMHQVNKPAVFMTYIGLKNIQNNWTQSLKSSLLSYGDKFIIPQIGLSMTEDGNPSAHYEQDVAAGLYDEQINNFIEGLRTLAIPAFVRIGYEFNGTSWNGYQSATYKAAFNRIANMIRASGLEIATVWCFAMDGVMNYMDYYPGNSTVDWWAIDIFSVNHFSDPNASIFLDSAYTHQKPVMIGETTPRNVGVLNGQQSWNDWFVPFFNFVHTKPVVKAFCYINWDWSQYPQWQNWGDARLEANSVVGENFSNEMDSLKYLHSLSESEFRNTLGYSDSTAPPTPQNISLISSQYPVELSWDSVTDPSGISHYKIFKNSILVDYALELPYKDYNVSAGEQIEYNISVIDRAGNESLLSAPLIVNVPGTLEKALNGNFDEGKSFWELNTFNASATGTFDIDSSNVLIGKNSAKINVTGSSGTNWHIQFAQSFKIYPNHKYKFKFTAKSSGTKYLEYILQQSVSPYTIYLSKSITLSSSPQTILDSVEISTNDDVKFSFLLGSSQLVTVWIDDVNITEITTGTTDITKNYGLLPINFQLNQNYPNPFNPSTSINYAISSKQFVSLKVYDVLGDEVATLVNEEKPAGNYEVNFDASKLSSGVYFYKLQSGSFMQTRKMTLLR